MPDQGWNLCPHAVDACGLNHWREKSLSFSFYLFIFCIILIYDILRLHYTQKLYYICIIFWRIKTVPSNMLFSSVQSLSCIQLFVTPWTAARQASLSITNSWSLLKLMSVESVMDVIQPSHLLSSLSPIDLILAKKIKREIKAMLLKTLRHLQRSKNLRVI